MIQAMRDHPIRGCDIFCGAGGSSAGARSAGVKMVGAIDMCATATATYKANFPDVHVVTGRLEEVAIATFKEKVGEVDILLASPECRNHTCAKGSAPRDEASRATAMQVIEYARELGPRWLVLENVVYMRPWSRYPELKHGLEELGYQLKEYTLDASDYGVAQKRRRLFLVGDKARQPAQEARKASWTPEVCEVNPRQAGYVEDIPLENCPPSRGHDSESRARVPHPRRRSEFPARLLR